MPEKLTTELASRIYSTLVRCRQFEEKIIEEYHKKEMRCPTHLSIGQEGVAAGVCAALSKEDMVFSTHRCHSHTVAKGADFKSLMAELYGKSTGCSRGKGGSMHFIQTEVNVMGSSAIVGGTVPLAVGASLAAKMQGKKTVSVAFFGDGAVEQDTFHESMNFASLMKLPVIFVCENNDMATCTHLDRRQPYPELYLHGEVYRIPSVRVDGTNVFEVYEAAKAAVERARRGEGASLIEGVCYRWKEHVGPNTDYHHGHRTKEELDEWMAKCPVKLFEEKLVKDNLVKAEVMKQITDEIKKELDEAVQYAKDSPLPTAEELYQDI